MSTKINSFFVNKIALSFNEKSQINELPKSKITVTGNLIRSQIYSTSSKKFSSLTPSLHKFPLLYITAGAQGSSIINQLTLKLLPELQKKFTIIHHTGKLDYDTLVSQTKNTPRYFPVDYIGLDDIGWVFHYAHLIISRAGANTSQEIVALKKSSLLIPLPFSQQNEQLLNAQWVKKNLPDITVIMDQNSLSEKTLLDAILTLSSRHHSSPKIIPSINNNLLKLIHEMV